MIFTLVLILHVLVCIVLIGSVLVQQGKGATMGAAFGTAGSQTVFGSSGAGNFLTKTTSVCAAIFFSTSLLLAYRGSFRHSVIDLSAPPPPVAAPVAPIDGSAPTGQPAPSGTAAPIPSGTAVPAQSGKEPVRAPSAAPAPSPAPAPK